MDEGRPIRVVSSKYDGSPHWEFDAYFVLERGPLIIATNFAGQELQTWDGPWTTPYDTRNHFWTDRWYNVMRCERPRGGGLEYWYCNVTTPAVYDGETLRYVDLDLDVVVRPDGSVELLDEDEFTENSARMGYPEDVVRAAQAAADELMRLAAQRVFPFNGAPPRA